MKDVKPKPLYHSVGKLSWEGAGEKPAVAFKWMLLYLPKQRSKVKVRMKKSFKRAESSGTPLVVQWLRLCASSAGSIPCWGSKIPHGIQWGQKKKRREFLDDKSQNVPGLCTLSVGSQTQLYQRATRRGREKVKETDIGFVYS